ncbi:transmembrane protein 135-like [Daphnia carinata]|uniref:transmembrane protein 135-like n=1 Tax=Daphnia carinata TaxID=120202 RepID=UPI00257F8514|nr:transmembrane protein 135-like [Daphnia carinata]
MAVFSKEYSPFSCYEVGHTWTPFCPSAAAGVGLSCFEEGIKIYSSVYLLSALLSGKLPDIGQVKRIVSSILQSSFFLGCNGFCFISAFCIFRKLCGKFRVLSSGFFPSVLANIIAILVERPTRRPALAVYVTNVASETIYNQLVDRGFLKPIPHGDIVLFSVTLACLFRWFQTTQDHSNFLFKLIRALVGDGELRPSSNIPAGKKNGKRIWNKRHVLCPHSNGCIQNCFQILVKRFLCGWGLHACGSLLLSFPLLLRKPSNLLVLLRGMKHVRFGAFLASLATAYQAVYCALRWIRGSNGKNHAVLAGLFAGISIGFYKNLTLILYLTWKTLEVLYYEGVEAGYLIKVPGFTSILYSLSTSILFHAAVMEPHNLKPAYWKFLMRITGRKISELNRKTLDIMGLQSSKMLPNFTPVYETNYLSDQFKLWLQGRGEH